MSKIRRTVRSGRLVIAAVAGILSGVARAITTWLIEHFTSP